ncbi:hypothetical protein [Beduini massiliensis]|uniref:hypothetical protein n=1 Tax=Beduini massiliensis TaxID=1585974 RepID=UPI0006941C09|nr:hypothetical protein [Beduini massiliensis]
MKWLSRLNERNLNDYLIISNTSMQKFFKHRLIIGGLCIGLWISGYMLICRPIVFNKPIFIYGMIGAFWVGYKIPYFYIKVKVKQKTEQVSADFPLWLSSLEVLILSNNIPNTLKKSLMTCPNSIKKDLQILVNKIEKDPMNQQSYIEFLSQYKLSDVNELMLDLYQFNYLDKSLMISEFAVLHKRLNAINTSNRQHSQEQNLFFIGAINSVPLFLLSIYILLIANMLSNTLMGG